MAPSTSLSARTLVVMRHADYTTSVRGEQLTDEGHTRAVKAALELQKELGDRKVSILTSEQPRAMQTGAILAEVFGTGAQPVQWLSAAEYPDDIHDHYDGVFAHLPPDTALVLVTHRPQMVLFESNLKADFCEWIIRYIPD